MAFNGIKLPIPSATSRSTFSIKEFKGLDKASGEDNFMPSRAVEMKNFIRDKVGMVKKRGGFEEVGSKFTQYNKVPMWTQRWKNKGMDSRISFVENDVIVQNISPNGFDASVCHFIEKFTNITKGIEIEMAIGFPYKNNYYILCIWKELDKSDKKAALLQYNGDMEFKCVSDIINDFSVKTAYVLCPDGTYNSDKNITSSPLITSDFLTTPLIVTNAAPSGGGSLMHSPNLLLPFVTETFTVKESDLTTHGENKICKRFQLSLQNISLIDGSKVVDSATWMKGKSDKVMYWALDEKKYRQLTEKGAEVLQSSVKIEVYTATGDTEQMEYEWKTLDLTNIFKEGTRNFINTDSAALWIPAAMIGASPVEGEPNVRITYIRNYAEYEEGLERLMSCDKVTWFGVGGHKDRIFLAGGNRIYYSGMDDPHYFGELNYIEPCSADKSIVAMGGQGKFLYAVDSDGITYAIGGTVNEDDSNTFIADASFVIVDRVQGERPIENATLLDVFGDEFCYLSEEGLVAIRHDDYYDKRYAQIRSRMVGNQLKGRITCACRWGNFLVIGAGSELYLLDELQQTTLPDFKFSGKQYEVFPFDFSDTLGTVEVLKVWVEEDKKAIDNLTHDPNYCWLWMMVKDVRSETYHVLRYNDTISTDTMEEISKPIVSQWVTPPIRLSSLYRKKNILRLALDVGEIGSAVKVEYRTDGATSYKPDADNWKTLRDYEGRFRVFDYEDIDYGLWTYQTTVPKLQLIINRRPSRKCYSIQFRFTNETENKLALSDFGFTYETEVI